MEELQPQSEPGGGGMGLGCFWWNLLAAAFSTLRAHSHNSTQQHAMAMASSLESQPCYHQLTALEGVFESPNYPKHYPSSSDCCYDIMRPNQDYCGVRLTMMDFNVEAPTEKDLICRKDWLGVEFCVPEGGSRFCGVLNGSRYEYPFQDGAVALRLHFHTDSEGEASGFRVRYRLLRRCRGLLFAQPPVSLIPGSQSPCYTRIREHMGSINSPHFPQDYRENLDCVYEFVRTDPFVCGIRMRTVDFRLESPTSTPFGGACSDFFHMSSCGFLCGSFNFTCKLLLIFCEMCRRFKNDDAFHFLGIARFQPAATSMKFHFHTDEMKNFPGFAINFEQIYSC